MKAYKVWADKRANRLHLLIRRSLSQSEIQRARQNLREASMTLRPDFSINIQHDPQVIGTETENSEEFSIVRIRRDLSHILCVLRESAA